MSAKIRITVDGRTAEVMPGTMLLQAMQDMGVSVPTLCHHPSLEPSGACRLCEVEITHPDWRGWSGLVASCLYPAQPGLQVSTRSERVRRTRRTLLELYLARCPDSAEIAALARAEGIDASAFPPRKVADLCIQCGLCTRVCEDLSVSAIAPLGRGTEKTVGPRPDMVGEDCVGCRACSYICPTGHIEDSVQNGKLRIWNRDFDLPLCSVEAESCRACGVCEEICPLAIPRVTPKRAGELAAFISEATCVGCGICAGACPTGAILQADFPDRAMAGHDLAGEDLRGRSVVYACSRSILPPGSDLIPVPCIGRVGLEQILECLARGAKGVLLICRDQATCPYGKGGRLGEQRALLADQLAALTGLGSGRIQYVRPAPGPAGPATALAEFRATLSDNPLQAPCDAPAGTAGLDRALDLLRRLRARPELTLARRRQRVSARGGREIEGAETALYVGDLPELSLLAEPLGAGTGLVRMMQAAVQLLVERQIPFQIVSTPAELADCGAKRLILFSHDMLPDPPAGLAVTTLAELAAVSPRPGELVDASGDSLAAVTAPGDSVAAVDASDDSVAAVTGPGFRFRITQDERRRLAALLSSSDRATTCASPYELLQIELLGRAGSWQQAFFAAPTLAFAAARSASGEEEQ